MDIRTGIRVCVTAVVAVEAAAGLALAINLAAPMEPTPSTACMPAMEMPSGHDNLVDINSAPKDWLVWVGLDDVLAEKIIGSRPFQSSRDLVTRGILPPGVFEKVKDRIIARQV